MSALTDALVLVLARDEGILDEVELVVMSPATRDEIAWSESGYRYKPSDGLAVAAGNEKTIPIEVNPLWVGPPRCLTGPEVQKYRSARRSADVRYNPDWRLKT